MLTQFPQDPPSLVHLFSKKPTWAQLSPKIPTTVQEKEAPVAVSDEEDSDSDSDGSVYEYTVDSEDNEDDDSYIRHRQEKGSRVVADFLQQVQENKFGNFQWPPPPNCPTYKLGMTSLYTNKLWFENESYTGEEYDTAKKFISQVRESWGYDVDCDPPWWLRPNLFPIYMDDERLMKIYGDRISSYAQFAIERINSQAKVETFELVRTVKAVATTTTMLLLTLSIKETRSDSEMAIRVAVSSPCGCGTEILECNLVPSLSSSR